jgi:hypothetical protein
MAFLLDPIGALAPRRSNRKQACHEEARHG